MVVCGDCADDARFELLFVPELGRALEAARCLHLRFAPSPLTPRPNPEESPLPYNEQAARYERETLEELTALAAAVVDVLAVPPPSRPTYADLGPWLAAQVGRLRAVDAGPAWIESCLSTLAAAWRVVDAPPEVRYAGPCGSFSPCPGTITYAPSDAGPLACGSCGALHDVTERWQDIAAAIGPVPGGTVPPDGGPWSVPCGAGDPCPADVWLRVGRESGTATCGSCGARHDITERRAWLLAHAEEMRLPATELARAIDGLGVPVTPATIRAWVDRSRLIPRGHQMIAGRVVPLYRVGDVRDLVQGEARRRAAGRHAHREGGYASPDALTRQQAAEMLGVTMGTVSQLVHRGTLARHPDGGILAASVRARLDRLAGT